MNPHQKHVLCVEDDEDTCIMINSLLGLINCEVTSVGTAGQARDRIAGGKFDLYLLDNWLPGGSGIELCRAIREEDSSTPIIFYSGAAYASDREQAMAAGAQAYLVKPAEISRLLDVIKQLLHLT
ncbi:MAG TPA: response regulator [Pyrinomonadaceae bacterium]|jgi:CheY-like chemotaxis protein